MKIQAIRMLKVEVTLLCEEADEERISEISLSQIAYEMNEGSMIGTFRTVSSDRVLAENVEQELVELGNDGTFLSYLGER